MNKLLIVVTILATISSLANAEQSKSAVSTLSTNDPPLTGDLLRNGVAVFAPELNQMLRLQRDGRGVLDITPISYTFSCTDPINPCVIR